MYTGLWSQATLGVSLNLIISPPVLAHERGICKYFDINKKRALGFIEYVDGGTNSRIKKQYLLIQSNCEGDF